MKDVELKYKPEVFKYTQELVEKGCSDRMILRALSKQFDPDKKHQEQLQESINLERATADSKLTNELKKGEWSFLGLKIKHTGNSDGYVLMFPEYDSATELWKCHLGNYSTLEDAQKSALFYFMMEYPADFNTHIHRKALYNSGTHLIHTILCDVLKREKITMPKEINRAEDGNGSILINGEKF